MTLTTLEAEDDRNEQSLQKYPDSRFARAGSRSSVGDAAPPAYAGTDLVRARMPAPQERPTGDEPVVDSPPLHEDQQSEQDAEREDGRRRGLLRRHPFAFSIGLLLLIPIAAVGYLYWDQSRHFESTDDAFIAARAFSIAPKISGYITAVPVTDNQHVAAGDVVAQIDDRDYGVALDQARA
jgi:membrane fusion protein (multidrug efflux system)